MITFIFCSILIYVLAIVVSPFVFTIVASIFLFYKPIQKYKFIFWFLNFIVGFNLLTLFLPVYIQLLPATTLRHIDIYDYWDNYWNIYCIFVILLKCVWLIPFYKYTDQESAVHKFLDSFTSCYSMLKRLFVIFTVDIAIFLVYILIIYHIDYDLFKNTYEDWMKFIGIYCAVGFGLTFSYFGLFVYLNIKKHLEKNS